MSLTNIRQQTIKVQNRLPRTTEEIAEHRSLNYFISLCTQKQSGGKSCDEHAVDFVEMQKLKFASCQSGKSFDSLNRSAQVQQVIKRLQTKEIRAKVGSLAGHT